MKLTLSIPGANGTPMKIDSDLPVPTGGLETTGQNTIHAFVNLTLVIAILVALWFIVRGGLDMITSEGQKEKIKSARERVIFALVGLIFIFLSFTMINIIEAFFGFNLLRFGFFK